MRTRNKVAACAALAAGLMISSTALGGCEGVGVQATDCIFYYGPVAESPYRGTVPVPGQASAGRGVDGTWSTARQRYAVRYSR
jgi:hypothetical protein